MFFLQLYLHVIHRLTRKLQITHEITGRQSIRLSFPHYEINTVMLNVTRYLSIVALWEFLVYIVETLFNGLIVVIWIIKNRN